MTIITNNWTPRISDKGVDPFGLGRWSYYVLRRKGGLKVMIILAYRVSQQYLNQLDQKHLPCSNFEPYHSNFAQLSFLLNPIQSSNL
jgi:hypothetical protein